jgi:hypothetical protein
MLTVQEELQLCPQMMPQSFLENLALVELGISPGLSSRHQNQSRQQSSAFLMTVEYRLMRSLMPHLRFIAQDPSPSTQTQSLVTLMLQVKEVLMAHLQANWQRSTWSVITKNAFGPFFPLALSQLNQLRLLLSRIQYSALTSHHTSRMMGTSPHFQQRALKLLLLVIVIPKRCRRMAFGGQMLLKGAFRRKIPCLIAPDEGKQIEQEISQFMELALSIIWTEEAVSVE